VRRVKIPADQVSDERANNRRNPNGTLCKVCRALLVEPRADRQREWRFARHLEKLEPARRCNAAERGSFTEISV
jgi:hypothetical protein